jgi:hypothetical protein
MKIWLIFLLILFGFSGVSRDDEDMINASINIVRSWWKFAGWWSHRLWLSSLFLFQIDVSESLRLRSDVIEQVKVIELFLERPCNVLYRKRRRSVRTALRIVSGPYITPDTRKKGTDDENHTGIDLLKAMLRDWRRGTSDLGTSQCQSGNESLLIPSSVEIPLQSYTILKWREMCNFSIDIGRPVNH